MTGPDRVLVERFLKVVGANIVRDGVHLTHVFPTPECPGLPFTYTAGLAEKGLPEVITFTLLTFTLPYETAGHILNNVADRAISERALEPGRYDWVLTDFPVWLIEAVDRSGLGVAYERVRYLGLPRHVVTGLQLVWPDAAGVFPWEAGYDEKGCPQPLLGPPPPG